MLDSGNAVSVMGIKPTILNPSFCFSLMIFRKPLAKVVTNQQLLHSNVDKVLKFLVFINQLFQGKKLNRDVNIWSHKSLYNFAYCVEPKYYWFDGFVLIPIFLFLFSSEINIFIPWKAWPDCYWFLPLACCCNLPAFDWAEIGDSTFSNYTI